MMHSSIWAKTWPWILGGTVSGMAILTRATGLVLIGVVGLALILRLLPSVRAGATLGRALVHSISSGIIWLISCSATVFLLLPALWVEPQSTVSKLWAWSTDAATEGHENPTFFRGIQHGDAGMLVYPIVLAWRTSPVEWIGLLLLVLLGFLSWQQRANLSSTSFKLLFVGLVFSIVYGFAMSIGAKKFDRYILPLFPVMTLLAAQGFIFGKDWLLQHRGAWWKRSGYALLTIAVIAQALSWNSTRPYRLDYYNPIPGGATEAQNILQMGWGQGGDQVVEFLLDQTSGDPITVQTSAVPSAFTYFLPDESPVQFRSFSLRTPAGWYETDYYVAGIQQTQRGLAPGYDLLEDHEPVHSVMIGGVSYFDVYAVRDLPLPAELMTPTACNLTFGDTYTLMQIVGRDNTIDFYFLTENESHHEAVIFDITLGWTDGTNSAETATLVPASDGKMSRLTIPRQRLEMPLEDAQIIIRATSGTKPLPVTSTWTSESSASGSTHSECYYSDPTG